MTHMEFFRALKQGQYAALYLFEGEEEYVKEQALAQLRAALLPEGLEQLNETLLDNPGADDVVAAAETLPMMADRRLVLVRECALLGNGRAKDEAAQSEALAGYLPKVPESCCLVFYCRGLADGRKKLTTALRKAATVVRFDPLEDAALSTWMRSRLKPLGKTISPQNAALLAFTSGRDLLTLSLELEKLAAYRAESAEIEAEDIRTLATRTLECTIFQWVDAILAGNEKEAFVLLGAMRGQGESSVGVLAMLIRQFRILLHLRLMKAEGRPSGEVQQLLGIPAFALRRAEGQAAAFDLDGLHVALNLLLDTDDAIKSGRIREDAALERALLMLRRA
ncbi:MAG TPA: DNA polymerase III subunit delta [Clostridia bacterium]|nr:DNA polymerase III subunit delta [Clostridia bacterium]